MITSNSLESIWGALSYSGKSEFEFIRIDNGETVPDLNVGFNSTFNRCLLLELPKKHSVDFQTAIKQNLILSFFRDTGYIVLELTDSNYADLFNDLIISIYQCIYQLSDVDEYSKIFIQTFYKWSGFFEDRKSEKLSQDIIKGIFGELFVLKSLVEDSDSSHLNDVMNSWRGPYDEGHDFVLDKKNIEVKTKEQSKLSVKISSEYQLDLDDNKDLELLVLSVETNPVDGQSLRLLLSDIKDLVVDKLGDFSIILVALSQKNISPQNIYQYDNYRFVPIEQVTYNCKANFFPKLVKSDIPQAVRNVRYTLQLSYLDDFILSEKKFNE